SPEGQLIPGTLLGKGIPKIDLGNNAYLCITSLMRNQVVTTYGLKKVIKMEQVSVVYLSNSCPKVSLKMIKLNYEKLKFVLR
ncbi:hypothetical protein M0D73_14070, partial [Shewanella putrefaciens]|uniref:hypothetical protein n=1 Tax=unclassified Shewanella TaxID=196818 RepID=UPI002005A3BD